MALTIKMLQAMGLDEKQIDQIIESHRDTINGLTEMRDNLKAELEKTKSEVERLKNVENDLNIANDKLVTLEKTEKELSELKNEFSNYKNDIEKKAVYESKQKAYKELLKKVGVSEKRFDAILKVTNLDSIELKDNKISDEEKLTEAIKSEWSDFIVTESKKGADIATPPDSMNSSEFEKLSLADKMQYANKYPNSAEVQAWLK